MSKSQQQLDIKSDSLYFTIYPTTNAHLQGKHIRSRSRKMTKHIDINSLIIKAKQHYQKGELKQSLLYYQQAIKYATNFQTQHNQTNFKDKPNIQIKQIMSAVYNSGTICLALHQYSRAQVYLKRVVNSSGNYKGNSILLLAICLNKQNKNEQSFKFLDYLCNQLKSVDGLFYRGKLMLKNMNYKLSTKDFTQLVQILHVNTVQAKLYLIQSKLYAGQTDNKMLDKLDQLLGELLQVPQKQNQLIKKCRNLKCEILISEKKIKQAENQLKFNQQKNLRDSWTLFLLSEIRLIQNKLDEQILLLNECITVKDHKRSVVKALETLVLNSMKNKDFYEAYEYSKRNWYIKIQNKATISLFKIAEAVTFLMKKKYGQALLLIGATQIQIYRAVYGDFDYLRNLHYSTLGYAYFSLGQYKDAMAMYQNIAIISTQSDHLAYQYNKKLCLGILAYAQSKIEESIKLFQSSTDYLMRAQPYFYISVILIQKGISTNSIDSDLVTKVIDIIDSGLKVGQNYQLYFYRALLYFYLGMNAEALDDVDRAVQKSEENVARFFYLRGLIFFQERNYENAIVQLTTCLSIDDKYYDAYLERAKIKLLSDQIQQAFDDLSNHPLHQQWQPLFLLRQHQFAKIIQYKLGEEHTIETANFQLGNFEQAGPGGKVVMAIMGQNYEQVRNLLQDAIEINFQFGCLGIDDLYLIKSYCCFRLGQYAECLDMLDNSQGYLRKTQKSLSYGEEDEKKLLAIKLNVIYTHFVNKNIERAKQLCKNLINDVYEGHVYDELSKMYEFLQYYQSNQASEDNIKITRLQVFQGNTMLSNYFPEQSINNLKFRYLIPFPKIRLHQLQTVPIEQFLFQFTIKDIDNRAQAPWMKKDENGVIFTNKIQIFENLKLYTETEGEAQGDNNAGKNQKQRMKQQLQLDAEVLNKLQRLTKNINKSKYINKSQTNIAQSIQL